MIPTLGNLALWMSLFFAIFQFLFSKKNNKIKSKFITVSVNGLLISSLISKVEASHTGLNPEWRNHIWIENWPSNCN